MSARTRRTAGTAAVAAVSTLLGAFAGIGATSASAAEGPVDAGIFVDKVDGLPADFIKGADISSILSLEESGVVFRDPSGQEDRAGRFAGVAWTASEAGAVTIDGAALHLECSVEQVHDAGDHLLVVLRVQDVRHDSAREALLACDRRFGRYVESA